MERIGDLVDAARRKDPGAFETLAELYRARLLHQIESRMGAAIKGSLAPEDIHQETLLRAFQAVDKFQWRGEDSFYRWLAGIAEHLIRNAAQKKEWKLLGGEGDFEARGISPSKALRRGERFDRLEKALGSLLPDQREALVLSRVEGLQVKEIAARMHRSENAVQKLLGRAVLSLKRQFGDTESLALPDRELRRGGDETDG